MLHCFVQVLSCKKGEIGKAAAGRLALQSTIASQSVDSHEASSAVAEASEPGSCR